MVIAMPPLEYEGSATSFYTRAAPSQPAIGSAPVPKSKTLRPLSVNEALQYSPFSSIVPFDPDVIPLPHASASRSELTLSSSAGRQQVRSSLDRFNWALTDGGHGVHVTNETIGALQALLESKNLSKFQFKSSPDRQHKPTTPSVGPLQPRKELSLIGAKVIQAVDIGYSTASSSAVRSPASRRPGVVFTSRPVETHAQSKNIKDSEQNRVCSAGTPGPPLSDTSLQPKVVVPSIPLSYHPDQYKSHEESCISEDASKEGKINGVNEVYGVSASDLNTVAGRALQELNGMMEEVFDAEDELKTGGGTGIAENGFLSWHGAGIETCTLSSSRQARLESLLQKVISVGRFQDICLDSLLRILKICDEGISDAKELDLQIQSEWGEEGVMAWSTRLMLVENALRASRTLLRIMTGRRPEKQLYSEEYLQRVIDLVGHVTRDCIVIAVETRPTDAAARAFQVATDRRKALQTVLHSTDKVLDLLLELLRKEPVAESCVNSIQFVGISLLFVENASTEKDSIVGVQRFESFRRNIMNLIAEIFGHYDEQRKFLIGEVLSSLQKLPTTRQHARQFRLADGNRLQLTSVLLMKFVQNSATSSVTRHAGDNGNPTHQDGHRGRVGNESDNEDGATSTTVADGVRSPRGASVALTIYESAFASAHYIVGYLANRASTASKTGETPHRHLLDMFVQDLIIVLTSPEWPASELLLRALVGKMVDFADSAQSSAPAKTMALETLGVIGSAVLEVTTEARQTARGLETDNTDLSASLLRQFDDYLNGQVDKSDLNGKQGTYRSVIEHLSAQTTDAQALSAVNFHLVQWAKFTLWGQNVPSLSVLHHEDAQEYQRFAYDLCEMLIRGQWSSPETYETVHINQCRLAYSLILLSVGICRALPRIFNILISSSKSDQVTVRSRSLKSVTLLLEKDPAILGKWPQVHGLIARCATDQSAMVRETALALLGKCLLFKSAVSLDMLRPVFAYTKDSSIAIRKRAVKLLKEVYQANATGESTLPEDFKSLTCEYLLQCVEDPDQGTSELACQVLEDLWLTPLSVKDRPETTSVPSRVVFREQMKLLITVGRGNEKSGDLLKRFLVSSTSSKSRNANANSAVNKLVVSTAFDALIDVTDPASSLSQKSILQVLTVYARADPRLFSQAQLELLQPYVSSLSTPEDLVVFRKVVVILRHVLPILPTISRDFLRKMQDELLKNVQKLAKSELNEVAACLWTINGVLSNPERLVNVETSVLAGLHKLETAILSQGCGSSHQLAQGEMVKAQRLMHLAGHFGHHCDFQPHAEKFQKLAWLSADSVAAKIVQAIKPFVRDTLPLGLRATALENVGLVCQAWPQVFNIPENVSMFQEVLRDHTPELKKPVLICFRDFFVSQDQHFGRAAPSNENDPLARGNLSGSMTASDKDGAAALIAQSFLKMILDVAIGSQDEYAFTATELIASIVRQGLTHPKECGPTLVALSTSSNPRIANLAIIPYQSLHLQHESMFERDYGRSLSAAFEYQRDIVKDCRGYSSLSWRSKLQSVYDVIKNSKGKTQTKFLTIVCSKISPEPSRVDDCSGLPQAFLLARFFIENLAFFDYGRMEDLTHVISSMERIFANVGAGVAHAVDTELFGVILDSNTGKSLNKSIESGDIASEVPLDRLKRLTISAMILAMLWEARSYLCRLYGLGSRETRREGRGRPPKDANKLPPKNDQVKSDSFVETAARIAGSIESRERSLGCCKAFTELIAIDKEHRAPTNDEGSEGDMPNTPSVNGDGEPPAVMVSGGSMSSKRKKSGSINGTPVKKRRGRPPGRRDSGKQVGDDEDWH